MRAKILLHLGWLVLAHGSSNGNGPRCDENVTLSISASAINLDIPSTFSLSTLNVEDNIEGLLKSFPTTTVTGTYTIAGRYCEPANSIASRSITLQVLVHGITFDRNYWSGEGAPGQGLNGTSYSWIDYASEQGYPTLSVDRICNGQSSKPNGLLVCQVPFNAEVLHGVVEAARNGSVGGRPFEKHSEGSLIGNSLSQQYPDDVDTYIQTGYTPFLILGGPGLVVAGGYIPALLADPVKFADVTDITYLAGTSVSGVEANFFAGQYSRQVADFAYDHRGTATTREIASIPLGELPAPGFKGAALAMNGERDQAFCARLPTDPLIGYRGDCGEGDLSYTALAKTLFPNAAHFEYVNLNDTCHNVGLHYTAQKSFKIAHEFLAAQGY
ncbi:hypothetical protein M409DRAFT_57793 [Zasmidium cellare ATCC 36951]|uniref:AB hydrolase-1 domain-containing protein n=1 Tax=Zasmidium cellare ATCC 36951 TaxID=1080233 RepID=A0A6A6CCE6_ZASCE|nr:uncharacterized protein M409DRAFT_57793 [Zasmidium cellare ATCC 36951]KAF2163126.1 hypothetical protein M409DRAFT_57793 [Zasmidium cellare ATCC 36951]